MKGIGEAPKVAYKPSSPKSELPILGFKPSCKLGKDPTNWAQFSFDIIFKDQEIMPQNCLDQIMGDESTKILLTQPMLNLT